MLISAEILLCYICVYALLISVLIYALILVVSVHLFCFGIWGSGYGSGYGSALKVQIRIQSVALVLKALAGLLRRSVGRSVRWL